MNNSMGSNRTDVLTTDFIDGFWSGWKPFHISPGSTIGVAQVGDSATSRCGKITNAGGSVVLGAQPHVPFEAGKQYSLSVYYSHAFPSRCTTTFSHGADAPFLILDGNNSTLSGSEQSLHRGTFVAKHWSHIVLSCECGRGSQASDSAFTATYRKIQIATVNNTVYTIRSPPTGPNRVPNPHFDLRHLEKFEVSLLKAECTSTFPGVDSTSVALAITLTPDTYDWDGAGIKLTQELLPFHPQSTVYLGSFAYTFTRAPRAPCAAQLRLGGVDFDPPKVPRILWHHLMGEPNVWKVAWELFSVTDEVESIQLRIDCHGDPAVMMNIGNLQVVPLN